MSQNVLYIWEMSGWSMELVSAPKKVIPKNIFRRGGAASLPSRQNLLS